MFSLFSCEDNFFFKDDTLNLNIVVTDSQGNNIPGARVCLYYNLALRNSGRDSCSASLQSKITGINGKAEFILPSNANNETVDYYITAIVEVGETKWTNLNKEGLISIGVNDSDVSETVIVYTPSELDNSSESTGLKVKIIDSEGESVKGVNVCLFQDPVSSIVNLYSCNGALGTSTTDSEGYANFFNLDERVYYINAFIKIGEITLGNDIVYPSEILQPDQLNTKHEDIVIKPVSLPDTTQFIIVNVLQSGQAVPNTQVEICLLKEDDQGQVSCVGSYKNKSTDNEFGLVLFPDLNIGRYQIKAGNEVLVMDKPLEKGERRLISIEF